MSFLRLRAEYCEVAVGCGAERIGSYEKILIDHIREFREALSIRTPDSVYLGGPHEFPYELGANG